MWCTFTTLKDLHSHTPRPVLTANSILTRNIREHDNYIKEKVRSNSFPQVKFKSTFSGLEKEKSQINHLQSVSLPDISSVTKLPTSYSKFRGNKLVAVPEDNNHTSDFSQDTLPLLPTVHGSKQFTLGHRPHRTPQKATPSRAVTKKSASSLDFHSKTDFPPTKGNADFGDSFLSTTSNVQTLTPASQASKKIQKNRGLKICSPPEEVTLQNRFEKLALRNGANYDEWQGSSPTLQNDKTQYCEKQNSPPNKQMEDRIMTLHIVQPVTEAMSQTSTEDIARNDIQHEVDKDKTECAIPKIETAKERTQTKPFCALINSTTQSDLSWASSEIVHHDLSHDISHNTKSEKSVSKNKQPSQYALTSADINETAKYDRIHAVPEVRSNKFQHTLHKFATRTVSDDKEVSHSDITKQTSKSKGDHSFPDQSFLKIEKYDYCSAPPTADSLTLKAKTEFGNICRQNAKELAGKCLRKAKTSVNFGMKIVTKRKTLSASTNVQLKPKKKTSKKRKKIKRQCAKIVHLMVDILDASEQQEPHGKILAENEKGDCKEEETSDQIESMLNPDKPKLSSNSNRRKPSVVPQRKPSVVPPVEDLNTIEESKKVLDQKDMDGRRCSVLEIEAKFEDNDFESMKYLKRQSLICHLQVRRLSRLLQVTDSTTWHALGVTPSSSYQLTCQSGQQTSSSPLVDNFSESSSLVCTSTKVQLARSPSKFSCYMARQNTRQVLDKINGSKHRNNQIPNLYIRTTPQQYIKVFHPKDIVFKKSLKLDTLYRSLDEKVYVNPDNDVISSIMDQVEQFVQSLIKRVGKRHECLSGKMIGTGSMYEKLRVATCPIEFDFMVELTSPSLVEINHLKAQNLPEVDVKAFDFEDDFQPAAIKSLFQTEYQNCFNELCQSHQARGYCKSTNFGIKFLYSLNNIPLEIDLVPCIRLGPQTCNALRGSMHPYIKDNRQCRVLRYLSFHVIFKDGVKLRLSTSVAEGELIRKLDETCRCALRFLKYLSLLSVPSNSPLTDSISTYQLKTLWLTTVLMAVFQNPGKKITLNGIVRYLTQTLEKVTDFFKKHNIHNRSSGKVLQDHFLFPYPVDMVRDNTYSTQIQKVVNMAYKIQLRGIRSNNLCQLERFTDPFVRHELHGHMSLFLDSRQTRYQILRILFENQ